MSHLAKIVREKRGQAMVEFALTSVLFLALLFGIIELGRFWYYSSHLGNSVRAAARYGAVLTDPTNNLTGRIQTYAAQEITSYLPPAGLQSVNAVVTAPPPPTGDGVERVGTATHGDTIRVTAVYNFSVLSGTIIPYFSGVIPLTRSATMNYEEP